jgi:hypothetical protein
VVLRVGEDGRVGVECDGYGVAAKEFLERTWGELVKEGAE